MSTEAFFEGTIREFAYGNYHVSLACVLILVDSTAKSETSGGVGHRITVTVY